MSIKITSTGGISAQRGLSSTLVNNYFACSVGIGVNRPVTPLHVCFAGSCGPRFESTSGSSYIYLKSSSTTNNSILYFADASSLFSGAVIYNHQYDYMALRTNGGEKVRIRSSGEVGIGNDEAEQKLTVSGNVSACGGLSAHSHANKANYFSGNVGIGTNRPGYALTIDNGDLLVCTDGGGYFQVDESACAVKHSDNVKAMFGTGNDLQIYHDGNNWIDANGEGDLYLRNLNSSGDVVVQAGASGDAYIKVNSGETALKATNNGATELYYDDSKKFETTNSGVCVTGGLSACNTRNGIVSAGRDLNTIFCTVGNDCEGTVTSITAGDGLDGGTITSSGTIAVNSTVVRTTGSQTIAGDKTFTGNTTMTGDLSVRGSVTCIDTKICTTSAIEVRNSGTGPAILANQTGAQPVVDFQDDGTSAFYIEDGGNVGIGCTNPTEKLEVAGNIIAKDGGFLAGVGGDKDGFVFHDLYTAGGNYYGLKAFSGPTRLSIVTDGVERLTTNANGCVGIGTTAPDERLTVKGNLSACGGLSATKMNSYFACDVGIGTNMPEGTLHVDGGSSAANIIVNSIGSQTNCISLGYGSVGAPVDVGVHLIQNGSSNCFIIDNSGQTNSQTLFKTRPGSGGSVEAMRIDQDQNVGIGESDPGQKLTVAGNVSALGHICTTCCNVQGKIVRGTSCVVATKIDSQYVSNVGETNITSGCQGCVQIGTSKAYGIAISASPTRGCTAAVGIGTDPTTATLHVSGAGYSGGVTKICVSQADDGAGHAGGNAVLQSSGWGEAYACVGNHYIGAVGGGLRVSSTTFTDFTKSTSSKMRLDTNGCLGIGTTTPNEKLTVAGNISACGTVEACGSICTDGFLYATCGRFSSNICVGGNCVFFADDSASAYLKAADALFIESDYDADDTDKHIIFQTGAKQRARITTHGLSSSGGLSAAGSYGAVNYFAGNVGIGTNRPAETLHVDGNICASGDVCIGDDLVVNGESITICGPSAQLKLCDTTDSDDMWITYGHGGTMYACVGYLGTTDFDICTTNRDIGLLPGTANVGIGTTSPDNKLDVEASDNSTSDTTGVKITNCSSTTNSNAGILFQNYDNNGAWIRSIRTGSANGKLSFGTNSGAGIAESNISERMVIDDDGCVGIGTSDPNQLLTVKGNISGAGCMQLHCCLLLRDTGQIRIGNGEDFRIYHNGTNNCIESHNGDIIFYNYDHGEDIIFCAENTSGTAAEYIRIDSSASNTCVKQNFRFADNVKAGFSTAMDMSICHTGSQGFIDNATGTLTICSADDFVVDAESDINLDANGGNVRIKDDGTTIGQFFNDSSNFVVKSEVNDKDLIFKGVDNSVNITALTLDMSDAGSATFNNKVCMGDGKLVLNGTAVDSTATELNLLDGCTSACGIDCIGTTTASNSQTFTNKSGNISQWTNDCGYLTADQCCGTVTCIATGDGIDGGPITSSGTICVDCTVIRNSGDNTITGSLTVDDITINASNITDSGTIYIDVGGDISLDAGGNDICLLAGGTEFGRLRNSSSDFDICSKVNDKDIVFCGVDNTVAIEALRLDMSSGGSAFFGHDAVFGDAGKVTFGAGGDLQIYHCSNHNYITAETGVGSLYIRPGDGNTVQIEDKDGQDMITAGGAGAVNLYYNNSKKFETTNTGIDVTGEVQSDSLDVDGASQLDGTLCVGSDGSGYDVKFFGDASGEYMQWDTSEAKLKIVHTDESVGLEVYTNATAASTQPQLKVGRGTSQYYGVVVDDRCANLIHRQDETSGSMETRFLQWDSNTSDTNATWKWMHGNGSGGSLATAMTLKQDGNLSLAGNIDATGSICTTSTSGIIIDTTGNAVLEIDGASGNTEAIVFKHAGTEVSRISHSNSTDLVFSTGSGVATAMTLDSSQDATFADKVCMGNSSLVLNGTIVTSCAAELNLLDGCTSAAGIDCTGTTTASNSQTFTNKGGNISQWTNDCGYTTCTGTTTPSNSQTFSCKGGCISMWTNDCGYTTCTGTSTITCVDATCGLCGGGSSGTVTVCHEDTSSQSSCNCSNGIVIQDVTLDTYGHVTGLGACNLDNRYYEHACICSFFNRGYAACIESAADCAIGWYTIATNTGDRAIAKFGLRDTDSSRHQSVIFYASHNYGTDTSNVVTVLHNSSYSTTPFRYIRIKDDGTYDGAALQVYIDNANNTIQAYILGDNFQSSGWVLKDWIPDADDPGGVTDWASFTEKTKVDLDLITQGGIATTGPIYAEGQLAQCKVLTTCGTTSLRQNDDVKALFGDDDDLQIYHSGSHGFIDNNKGTLCIRNNVDGDDGGDIKLMPHDNENGIIIYDDAGVSLYYNNSEKLETTSAGACTTGTHCATTCLRSPTVCGTTCVYGNQGLFCGAAIGGVSVSSCYALCVGSCGTCSGQGSIHTTGGVCVGGALSKASGCFNIQHPLPALSASKCLSHSFVEAPQADNIYSGVVELTAGKATVNIDSQHGMTDGTLTALNRCFRTFTTNETNWDPVRGSVTGNTLTVESCVADSTATVSWMVIGERHDLHMLQNPYTDSEGRIRVEYDKPEEDDD